MIKKFINSLFLLLIAVGFVAASISLTDPTIPSTVVQGASFSLVIRVSGSDVQNVQGTITPPSGISCNPVAAQSITISGGTGSASWTCSGDTAGDYSNQISLAVTAQDSSNGASLSDSSTTGLIVQSPVSLVVSSAVSSSSITTTTGSVFTVAVNNNGDASTTVNIYRYANSSNVAFNASNLTSITVPGNSLVTRSWNVSSTTTGSYQILSIVESSDVGNSSTNRNITVTESSSSSGSSSSSSGGGGGGAGAAVETATAEQEAVSVTAKAGEVKALSDFESKTSVKVSLEVNSKVTYTYCAESHSISVTSINGTSVTFTIASTPKTVTMKKGEEKSFDVNSDGANDVAVKIVDVTSISVIMSVTNLKPVEVSKQTTSTTPSRSTTPRTTDAQPDDVAPIEAESTTRLSAPEIPPIAIVGVVILLAVVYFVFARKNK